MIRDPHPEWWHCGNSNFKIFLACERASWLQANIASCKAFWLAALALWSVFSLFLPRGHMSDTTSLLALHSFWMVFPSPKCSAKLTYSCVVSANVPNCWTIFSSVLRGTGGFVSLSSHCFSFSEWHLLYSLSTTSNCYKEQWSVRQCIYTVHERKNILITSRCEMWNASTGTAQAVLPSGVLGSMSHV